MLVQPGIEPATSHTTDWRLTTRANQRAVKYMHGNADQNIRVPVAASLGPNESPGYWVIETFRFEDQGKDEDKI